MIVLLLSFILLFLMWIVSILDDIRYYLNDIDSKIN